MSEPPKKQPTDIAHTLTKAGLGALTAGAGAELFSLIIAPPLEKRRDEWMDTVAERLGQLERHVDGFSVRRLADNEEFVTVVMHATTAALKNHNQTKLEMLRSAVLNAALGLQIDDNIQLIFLRLVDELTPLHLKLLAFLDDPRGYGERHGIDYPDWSMGGISTVLEHAIPALRKERALYDQLGKDLENRGLISNAQFHVTMSGHGMFQRRTTELGRAFIGFVSDPLE